MRLPQIKRRLGSPLRRKSTSYSARFQAKNFRQLEFVRPYVMTGLYLLSSPTPFIYFPLQLMIVRRCANCVYDYFYDAFYCRNTLPIHGYSGRQTQNLLTGWKTVA
jgi:hypothetical protein